MEIAWIIGICIVVIALLALVFTHSMAMQRFGVMELFTLVAVAGCMWIGYHETVSNVAEEYGALITAQVSGLRPYMNELETAGKVQNGALELYSDLGTYLTTWVTGLSDSDELPYESASLVQLGSDGTYAECFTVGENQIFWTERKEEGTEVVENAMTTGVVSSLALEDGDTLYAVTGTDSMTAQFAAVVEITPDQLTDRIDSIRLTYLRFGLILACIITVCYIVIVRLQNRDIYRMLQTIRRITDGKEDLRTAAEHGIAAGLRSNEMRLLYSGLRQLSDDVRRINYEKYKALQVYYRFAPKDIERILGKNSILDVKVGEQVNLEATLAYISFNINDRLEQHEQFRDINAYYTRLGEIRKRRGGIIFNSSTDLSTIQMMFNEQVKEAVQFGIEMALEQSDREMSAESDIFVLLHRTSFVYGISGDEEQTFAFAHSHDMKEIEKHVESLRSMGIRMAVTDYVEEMLPAGCESRYIGYIREADMKLNLYEVLDAYPAKERQQRLMARDAFDAALRLFYQEDFFFARTAFTEILKDCPQDAVAKHYIFRCESCLNGEIHGADRFSLL